MSTTDVDAARERAEARFRRTEESRAAAASAMADVAAAKEAELAKTARLKALRLAKEKEAADLAAAAVPASKGAAGRRKATGARATRKA